MNPLQLNKSLLYVACLITLLSSCSSESTSWLGQGYNNITAHYNGYFYSREEVKKIEQTILTSQQDDFNRVLKIFPRLDSTVAKGYDKEAQEAIKMASLAIQRHPHSKWVDDAYILVGKARLYTLDWGNAIQTFKYVNTKSKDPDAKHQAIIVLLRTFVEHEEFSNAQAAIDFLQKEKLNKTNFKNFHIEKAYYHQMRDDYDNMVRSLTAADPFLKKKDRRGRLYFIIGQVYQKLGFESEAYNYYKKCLNTNPEYEVDFYARLYLAQVAEISRSRDIATARKSFKKLLKDSKNKEFKDKIYYEMGVFELKQKNIAIALDNFNLAIRNGNNTRVDGEAYLQVGKVYYDTLKNYELSQAYYDSALTALPKDFEGYDKIKARAEILDAFVKNLKVIQWQDSLLRLSGLDSIELRHVVDSAVTARKALALKKAGKKKRQSNRVEIGNNVNNNIFSDDEAQEPTESTDWYFGNPSAMGLGQEEFNRVWGSVALEDNWRRSQRSSGPTEPSINPSANIAPDPSVVDKKVAPDADPVDVELANLSKEIPRTEEQKKESRKKVDDAYFNVGDIYYYKLLENKNAVTTYNKLLERFPQSEHAPEVLYKLYLILKETDPMLASDYANQLKEKYPNSTFARILVNPNYVKENSETAEKQKVLYKTAYQYFSEGDYKQANQIIAEATALGTTAFSANIELLKILIIGKTEDISAYQYQLGEFVKLYPDAEVTPYAQKLLEASKEFQQTQEKQKGITYIPSFEESHYFVIVSLQSEKISDQISTALENFNAASFGDQALKTSTLTLSDQYVITMVSELPRISYALQYYKAFIEKLPEFTALHDHKISNFVITKDNFDIFYRTKGLDEYIKFFEKNYHPEN